MAADGEKRQESVIALAGNQRIAEAASFESKHIA